MPNYSPQANLTDEDKATIARVFGVPTTELERDFHLTVSGPNKVLKACYCGCGKETYSTWFPGCDSKYKAGLLAVSRGKRTPEAGSWDALTPEAALKELRKLEKEAAARKAAKKA
jgi:hypothetical protein